MYIIRQRCVFLFSPIKINKLLIWSSGGAISITNTSNHKRSRYTYLLTRHTSSHVEKLHRNTATRTIVFNQSKIRRSLLYGIRIKIITFQPRDSRPCVILISSIGPVRVLPTVYTSGHTACFVRPSGPHVLFRSCSFELRKPLKNFAVHVAPEYGSVRRDPFHAKGGNVNPRTVPRTWP